MSETKSNFIIKKTEEIKNKPNNIIVYSIIIAVFFIVLILSYSNKETFTDNNKLEQQMFEEMTDDNRTIYIELPDKNKREIFLNWKNMKK